MKEKLEQLGENVRMPFVVACIPAFNEERSIARVVVQTSKYVDMVIVCDDGSIDCTGEIAEALGAIVVRHERNVGYGAALRSLFMEAQKLGADMVVTLDADGQHDPGAIPRLLEQLMVEDIDLVIGSRFLDGGSSEAPGWRENGVKLITGLVMNDELTDAQSGFRAYNRLALESLVLTEQGMGVSTEILLKAEETGLRIAEIPVSISYGEGTSTQHPLVHGFEVVLSTVKHLSMRRPLLFYGLPGFLALCVAGVFWIITLRLFATSQMININVVLVALSTTIMGLMLMTTAMILWVLINVISEMRASMRYKSY